MRNLAIVGILSAALVLSSCTSKPEDTAALIKSSCAAAKDTLDVLQPWIDAGQIKGKAAANIETAREALFGTAPQGLCVGEPSGTLAGALVKISSFALTLSIALRDTKKG